jgi:diketogulonate reductase-like aldo/keto reductase
MAPPNQRDENLMQTITANGATIPAIGLGVMTLKDDVCVKAVDTALRIGYRHIDTAQMYGNEREVGEGLRASGVPREDVFVTTKVWHDRQKAGDLERSVDESLDRLKLSSVDLLLIHWPNKDVPLKETFDALCKTKREGKTRHIGLANFTVALIEQAVKVSSEPLVTNQIEVHPFIDRSKVIDASRRHGVSITAYCPIARGAAPDDAVLARIGAAHGKSPAQVSLRYLIQQGIIPIPRTANPKHLAENLAVFDFTLSDAEMKDLAGLAKANKRIVSPPHAPQWDG